MELGLGVSASIYSSWEAEDHRLKGCLGYKLSLSLA